LTDGIEEIEESSQEPESEESNEEIKNDETESIEEIESNEPDTRSLREIAREKLKEKLDAGYDLGDKTEKARICHEIANEIENIKGSCSYDTVAKEVRFVLKVKKKEDSQSSDGIKKIDGHSIKTKKTSKVKRPARTETEEDEESNNTLNEFEQQALILKQFADKGESAEEMMISFTLQDVSFFIEALGLPKPQIKKLKQRAKQIAMFNEIQRINGNPENIISISDSVLKPLMMLGLGVTFLEPIIKKYFPKDDKSKTNKGITTSEKTLRG